MRSLDKTVSLSFICLHFLLSLDLILNFISLDQNLYKFQLGGSIKHNWENLIRVHPHPFPSLLILTPPLLYSSFPSSPFSSLPHPSYIPLSLPLPSHPYVIPPIFLFPFPSLLILTPPLPYSSFPSTPFPPF